MFPLCSLDAAQPPSPPGGPRPVLLRKPNLEAPQATAGPDGVCLLTELQALPSPLLSPISPKHAHGQWILLFLLAHKLFLPLTRSGLFPFVASEIKSVYPVYMGSFQESERIRKTSPPLLSNLHSSRKAST